ncbi:hypothetical protein ACP70R_005239 [Stipagrostis hirtigluma subsp. patula]
MELNTRNTHKAEDGDMLSMLPEDILLSILGRLDIIMAAKTSVLSTRWKRLPWLLRELVIDVQDFLPAPHPNPIEAEHMDEAMASLTKAIRSFLATPRSEAAISKLQLKLYLVSNYSDVNGPLVSQAVDTGTLKDLDLAILDEKEPEDYQDEDMVHQTRNHGRYAPHSSFSVLELSICCLGKLEVLHLPKLELLCLGAWFCRNDPLSLGVVPSLKELQLICCASVNERGFKLSEVLRDTTAIHDLTLNIQEEKEGKELCTAFNKLRKLSLHDIFVEFDFQWTIVFLEAAASVEMFDVEIWKHPCIVDDKARRRDFGERTNPSWKVAGFTNGKEWQLKEFQVTGFSPKEQQMTFLRAVMERAPNLQTVILNDYPSCEDCDKICALPRFERLPAECIFPNSKDEQDMVVKQLIGEKAYSATPMFK